LFVEVIYSHFIVILNEIKILNAITVSFLLEKEERDRTDNIM